MIYDDINQTITTERLQLRLFQPADAETVTKLCNNYSIYKGTLTLPYPYTMDCAISWIETHVHNFNTDKSYEFAVCDRRNGTLYGAIALTNHARYENGEIAYWIGEEYWGKGYATEASKAMIDFAFQVKNFHKVYARHFASNPASGKVIQKIGMIQEGILLDHVKKDNQFEDLVYYGILNN
ncbi:GNAT family N-acetyltransferase [Paenibacillus sp. JCM 10914]|uniref:GNAT family N-acetyltransferase n=1 Tax=Paenibacillus sp. JCM 10914 TaxID=1236974 RepID=UPI0003CC53DB|nr:GNAT family N-acetyltransferase [Paenibacillus sp. JCM 10914]GAE05200.1 acetyltransferase, GNAT family protein [Paenibacillus sp. JCM 10914]